MKYEYSMKYELSMKYGLSMKYKLSMKYEFSIKIKKDVSYSPTSKFHLFYYFIAHLLVPCALFSLRTWIYQPFQLRPQVLCHLH